MEEPFWIPRLFLGLTAVMGICLSLAGPAHAFEKPTTAELKKRLTPQQYSCTQEEGTEPPFKNEYWDHHEEGIYVDVVSGEPLFSSQDKYDSGSGWPSFTKPLKSTAVRTKLENRLGFQRTELRSQKGDSHLGHVFDDGPGPSGLRYCVNSASLKFVPVKELKGKGYGEFLPLFEKKKK